MSYAIHCPECGVVVQDENGQFTEAWSGWKYRCMDHKLDAAPCSYVGWKNNFVEEASEKRETDHWPTPTQRAAARHAMEVAEITRPMTEADNRHKSARVAIQAWGEGALHRRGVTDEDRLLMKEILNGER